MHVPISEDNTSHLTTTLQEVGQNDKVANDVGPSQPQQRSNLEELNQRNAGLKQQLTALQMQHSEMNRRFKQAKAGADYNRRKAHDSQKEAERWRDELSIGTERNRRSNEERRAELESLKALIGAHNNTDQPSISDHLSEINELVEQLALDLSSRWEIPASKTLPDFSKDTREHLDIVLGSQLLFTLSECNIRNKASLTILQYALQVALSFFVNKLFLLQTSNVDRDHPIPDLSRKVMEDEIQPVYGRWRSITYRYLHLIQGEAGKSEDLSRFVREATFAVYHVALSFGLPLPRDVYQGLKVDLQPILADIGRKTVRLARITTEEIISKNYQLYKPGNEAFNTQLMQTPFQLRKTSATDNVVGVISLGMTYTAKPGSQNVQPMYILFRQAKVITERTLIELMDTTLTTGEQFKPSEYRIRVTPRVVTPPSPLAIGSDAAEMPSLDPSMPTPDPGTDHVE